MELLIILISKLILLKFKDDNIRPLEEVFLNEYINEFFKRIFFRKFILGSIIGALK